MDTAGLEALARQGMQDARPVELIGVDMLRRAVLTGLLEAGQLLRQDELATNFGVSRMPVRVALRQVESEGLVRHLPRRGFVVATLTPQEIEELDGGESKVVKDGGQGLNFEPTFGVQ